MTFQPSARMIARRSNVNIAALIDILSYRRCYGTDGEEAFLEDIIDTISGIQCDEFGNRYIRIPKADGSQSDVLWSCHTDSVHSPRNHTLRQNIKWDITGNILSLNEGKPGQCLGADDGCGIWLMMEMLDNGVPGLYIFHRAEEVGGKGSRWIEKNTPELLDGINFAIAFDRKGLSDIITHQGGQRCCSDTFGKVLGAALNRVDGLAMKLDQTGSFTDTAVYTGLVPECTNLSVGYYNQHGPRETLDVRQMIKMRQALLQLDLYEDLAVERVAGTVESRWPVYTSNYQWKGNKPNNAVVPATVRQEMDKSAWGSALSDEDAYEKWQTDRFGSAVGNDEPEEEYNPSIFASLLRMVTQFPRMAVKMLMDAEYDHYDFADAVFVGSEEFFEDDEDLKTAAESVLIQCENCNSSLDIADVDEDLRCIYCYASLREPFLEAVEAQDSSKLQDLEDARCA